MLGTGSFFGMLKFVSVLLGCFCAALIVSFYWHGYCFKINYNKRYVFILILNTWFLILHHFYYGTNPKASHCKSVAFFVQKRTATKSLPSRFVFSNVIMPLATSLLWQFLCRLCAVSLATQWRTQRKLLSN